MANVLWDKTHRHPIFDAEKPPARFKAADLDDGAVLLLVEALCRAFGSWTTTTQVTQAFGASYDGQTPVPGEGRGGEALETR